MINDIAKELRKKKGLSQQQLASEMFISQQTISKLEKGETSFSADYIRSYAVYFNVSSDYLLGITQAATPIITDEQQALRTTCDYTQLNEDAALFLHNPITNVIKANIKGNCVNDILIDDIILKYHKKLNQILSNINFFILCLDLAQLDMLEKQLSNCYSAVHISEDESVIAKLSGFLDGLKSKIFDINVKTNYLFKDDIYEKANHLCLEQTNLMSEMATFKLKEMIKEININELIGDNHEQKES